MPNIIEQQDLLKGLPDTRLMTLLQNPVADIPPFLVAAEAQRRQALRQQFAGSENKESVVDTLTKQLAGVPQNISAPPQKPMQIPQTPQMQGVAALQQQQAIQQAAQPQQMRGGGMVQRYQYGGKVEPWWTLPNFSGPVTAVKDWVGGTLSPAYELMTTPYEPKPRIFPTIPPNASAGTTFAPMKPDPTVKPVVPDPGKMDTSTENKTKDPENLTPQPGETEDEFRARLEALLRTQEPSDWEKAQKWAAMAEQFLDPSKTTMQSVAGAAKAFAEGAGAEQRAARESQLALEKGLLEYDVGKAESDRESAAAARKEQIETQRFYAEQAQGQIKAITTLMDDVARNKADYIKNTYPVNEATGQPTVNPNDPALQNFDSQLRQLSETLKGYIGQQQGALRGLGGLTRTDPSVLMWDGENLSTFGGKAS